MDSSLWQDEAQLANMFLEEDSNRSSSESNSNDFYFNSTAHLKKNLATTFDKELSNDLVAKQVDHLVPSKPASSSSPVRSGGQLPSIRPPLPTGTDRVEHQRKSRKKFAVFLRIRPLQIYKSTLEQDDDVNSKVENASTIEVLEPSDKSNDETIFPTTIRTYPPMVSNVHKVNMNRNARSNFAYAKEFHFDRVMGPKISQKDVYFAAAAPIIHDLLNGRDKRTELSRVRRESALLFSYGITNAGKTHTVLGDINSTNKANWGIIPRAISDVFQRNRVKLNVTSTTEASESSMGNCKHQPPCDLYISFFEIYNENIYDLMPEKAANSSKHKSNSLPALKIRECRGQTFVRGLKKLKVRNEEHGISLVKEAYNKRHTSCNNLNMDSSRSHFVCQMEIVPLRQQSTPFPVRDFSTETDGGKKASNIDLMSGYSTDEEAVARSRLSASTIWIVDLAGSERSKRTRVGSIRQKESTKINNSLMTLMRCLNAMKENGDRRRGNNVIPFRESKLTHIFMSHLTSKSAARTAMMVNVNPSVEDFDETQHVLKYSRKAKLIEMNIDEFGAKRKQFFGEEYDRNGRKKFKCENSKNCDLKKPKHPLLSRMAKKLSPKKALEKIVVKNTVKEERIVSSRSYDHAKEIEALKNVVQIAEERVYALKNKNTQLQVELESKEDQIRAEVAMEMEARLRETRTKQKEKYDHLRSVMQNQMSKNDVSLSISRAGNQIEELLDKIDECEQEMLRMSKEHRQEVICLNAQIDDLNRTKEILAKEKVEHTIEISNLKQALKKSHDEVIHLKGFKKCDNIEMDEENFLAGSIKAIKKRATIKQKIQPRKALGNATNQSSSSRVLQMSIN
ncbi:unnamed protein product [Pseudo-nitzschia multistriata]|uniref:Kinesin-like protein n=1 Tax=Pseudo-nitzschia multistriata TaxID=183589 RepID=A0A448Z9C9_9STRA|nr:unnamed protein product [Pseudo-nitzschia multistriata]